MADMNTQDGWTVVNRKKEYVSPYTETEKRKYRMKKMMSNYYPIVCTLTKNDWTLINQHDLHIFCECCQSELLIDIIKKKYKCNGCYCCSYY